MSPAEPHRVRFAARLFTRDAPLGESAEVHVGTAGLAIATAADQRFWPYEDLTQRERPRAGEPVRLARAGGTEPLVAPDARLLGAILEAAPGVAGRIRRPPRASPALILAVVAAAGLAGLALVATFGLPMLAGSIAASIPVAWEEELGAAMVERLAPPARRIEEPRARAAIEAIVERLAAARPTPYRFRVLLVDAPEVNAFAAPGGHIAVFAGLVRFARTPEELAGVIAHEMEHVALRHVTRGVLERASLGVVLGLLVGDAGGAGALGAELARMLGELSFSRAAEAEADREALERLVAAGVDPRGMPALFARMAEQQSAPRWAEFLATHPAPESRARRLAEAIAARPAARSTPLLEPAAWRALRAAAGGRPAKP